MQKIEDIAGIYSVDIVFSSAVNEDFCRHIKQNGLVLYEANDLSLNYNESY